MSSSPKITLGQFLWHRIHQLGVPGLSWLGNQNELNAAYAADGYARAKDVPGCLVTTHGVGELSALNGIAGAMSEHVKVVHVVGQTTRAMQKGRMMIHHSIGNRPDHSVYAKASEGLRVAGAELWDVESATGEIDRVLRECWIKSGPVYIFLPLDLAAEEVDTTLLETPINVLPDVDEEAQSKAVKAIVDTVREAKMPTLLVDAWTQRFGAAEEARALVRKMGVPWYSASMGKGVVDETEEMFVGVWNGEVSSPGVKEAAKEADLVVSPHMKLLHASSTVANIVHRSHSASPPPTPTPPASRESSQTTQPSTSTPTTSSSKAPPTPTLPSNPSSPHSHPPSHLNRTTPSRNRPSLLHARPWTSIPPTSPNPNSGPASNPSCAHTTSSSAKPGPQTSVSATSRSRTPCA
jgi:pyruvate decarboxylase